MTEIVYWQGCRQAFRALSIVTAPVVAFVVVGRLDRVRRSHRQRRSPLTAVPVEPSLLVRVVSPSMDDPSDRTCETLLVVQIDGVIPAAESDLNAQSRRRHWSPRA